MGKGLTFTSVMAFTQLWKLLSGMILNDPWEGRGSRNMLLASHDGMGSLESPSPPQAGKKIGGCKILTKNEYGLLQDSKESLPTSPPFSERWPMGVDG